MIEAGNALSAWESFYVIVGSSAGALIGLQFVVITLIAGSRHRRNVEAVNAFGTPTVVHLTGALVVSALMSAPWASLAVLSVVLGLYALGGLVYGAIVVRRAQRQTDYQPVREDWVWYVILPFVGYIVLAGAAALLCAATPHATFAVGAAA